MTPADPGYVSFSYQTTVSVAGRPVARPIVREVFSDTSLFKNDLSECYSNEVMIAVIDTLGKSRYPYIYVNMSNYDIPQNMGYYKKILKGLDYIHDDE